jgi:hypothetical protein
MESPCRQPVDASPPPYRHSLSAAQPWSSGPVPPPTPTPPPARRPTSRSPTQAAPRGDQSRRHPGHHRLDDLRLRLDLDRAPPSSYTTALKIQQIAEYGYTNTSSLCDVAPGTNGSCGGACLCTAGTGYDVPTGTPDGIAVFTG